MNLAIINTDTGSSLKTKKMKSPDGSIKIKGEYPLERIIRIGSLNGIKRIFCIINWYEPELKYYLSKNNFGVALKFIEQRSGNFKDGWLNLAATLNNEPVILVNSDSVFNESEFSEFISYSLLEEDADGVLAVTRYNDDENRLCVAMNDEDIILKFSDSKEGYNWATGGICYFTPKILKEAKDALDSGIFELEKFMQLLIVKGYTLKGFSFLKIIKIQQAADIARAEDIITGNDV